MRRRGRRAARQAASKTNDTAGDGTTTATILSAAIIAEGMKIVAAGTNPVQLTRGIEKTVAALVKELQSLSVPVSDDDLANVATVSAGNNEVVRAGGQGKGRNAILALIGSRQAATRRTPPAASDAVPETLHAARAALPMSL